MSRLVNIFAASGVSLFLAGCATTHMSGDCMGGASIGNGLFYNKSFSQSCADSKAARTMLESPRKDMQLVGATALRNQSETIDKAFNDVQNGKGAAPVKTAGACTVKHAKERKNKGLSKVDIICPL